MNHNNNNNNNNREYTRISTTSTDHISTTTDETSQQGAVTTTTSNTTSTPFSHDGSATSATAAMNNGVPTSRTMTEKITDKFIAVIWVVVASIVFHYTNSAHVYLLTNNNTNNTPTANVLLMQIVMIGLGINTVLFLYLLIYLPYVKGLHDSTAWDVYCPRVIPCMTLIGLSVLIILIRATYPIWGFLAPFIIGIEAMGLLFSFHFIPVGFL